MITIKHESIGGIFTDTFTNSSEALNFINVLVSNKVIFEVYYA